MTVLETTDKLDNPCPNGGVKLGGADAEKMVKSDIFEGFTVCGRFNYKLLKLANVVSIGNYLDETDEANHVMGARLV